MTILDNPKEISKLDKSNIYGSITHLPQQCQHAWEETQKLTLPPAYQKINKLIMTGMGGSGLGARIIESVYSSDLKTPLHRVNDYDLPAWADQHTLVICTSFSGTTEETLSTVKQAQAKGCPWLAIATGGSLIDLAKKNQVPFYQIDPIHNPSKQPRMAIGYLLTSQLVIARKAKLIPLPQKEFNHLLKVMKKIIDQNQQAVKTLNNPAKKLAQTFLQKEIIFVAARHLTGAGHTAKNQMNENAKNLSHRHDLPELNHHLMEGLKFPDINKKDLVFFLLNSQLYPQRIQQRFQITQEVIKKNKVATALWQASSKTKLSQAFEFIQFAAFANFYLSLLNHLDPAPIPWVDYFKKKLGQPLGQWK